MILLQYLLNLLSLQSNKFKLKILISYDNILLKYCLIYILKDFLAYLIIFFFLFLRSPIRVHIGGIIQFSVFSVENSSVSWRSENTKIIDINPSSGLANAKDVGETSIIY